MPRGIDSPTVSTSHCPSGISVRNPVIVSFQRGHSQLFQLSESWQEVETRGLLSVTSGLLPLLWPSPLILGVQGLSPAWLRKGTEAKRELYSAGGPFPPVSPEQQQGQVSPAPCAHVRASVPVCPFCLSKDESQQLRSEAAEPGPAAPVTKPPWRLPLGEALSTPSSCLPSQRAHGSSLS